MSSKAQTQLPANASAIPPQHSALPQRPFATHSPAEAKAAPEVERALDPAAQSVHNFGQLAVQPRLIVTPPDDDYEREADRVAEQAVSGSTTAAPRRIQPSPVMPEQAAAPGAAALEPDVNAAISRARHGGQPLAPDVRTPTEEVLGRNLGEARVHTDLQADRLSRELDAQAVTVGSHVFFRHGAYRPAEAQGRDVLNHELAHVAQQAGGAEVAQRWPWGSKKKVAPFERKRASGDREQSDIVEPAPPQGGRAYTGVLAPLAGHGPEAGPSARLSFDHLSEKEIKTRIKAIEKDPDVVPSEELWALQQALKRIKDVNRQARKPLPKDLVTIATARAPD